MTSKKKAAAKSPKSQNPGSTPAQEKTPAASKAPGVIATIKEIMATATEANPVGKGEILETLVARFPDRKRKSMMASVNTLVPSDLRKKHGVNVVAVGKSGNRRYFVGGLR